MCMHLFHNHQTQTNEGEEEKTRQNGRCVVYFVERRIKEHVEIHDKQKKCIDFFFYLQVSRRLGYKS